MTGTKQSFLVRPVSIAPLVSFRIAFGAMLFFCLIRFWWRGWISSAYVNPPFHFTYMGFDWVRPMDSTGMHLLFLILIIASLFIAIGLFYRISTIIFFLGFTYVELLDSTVYLNHYYFINLIAFLLIWLPANRKYAVDTIIKPSIRQDFVPAWTIGIIRFQIAVVYIFAGLAKLNSDWLIHAEPMKTWLPANSHLPLVGGFMYETWVAYLFSWFGAAYDLFIVFFLLNKKTRPIAFFFVFGFHISTAIFFPGIGMFPYVMILNSLIFFSGDFHNKILSFLPRYAGQQDRSRAEFTMKPLLNFGIVAYVLLQLIVPLRFLFYPDRLFWNEEGYRFSWRVMLMEKSGASYFTVKDKTNTQFYEVDNRKYLTPLQEKMMSTQPDMMLRYAHFLAKKYKEQGIDDPKVYATIYVALNGVRSRLFADSTVNLAAEPLSWKHYSWVLPFKNVNQ